MYGHWQKGGDSKMGSRKWRHQNQARTKKVTEDRYVKFEETLK